MSICNVISVDEKGMAGFPLFLEPSPMAPAGGPASTLTSFILHSHPNYRHLPTCRVQLTFFPLKIFSKSGSFTSFWWNFPTIYF